MGSGVLPAQGGGDWLYKRMLGHHKISSPHAPQPDVSVSVQSFVEIERPDNVSTLHARLERSCVRGDMDAPAGLPAFITTRRDATVPRLLHQTWKSCELLDRQQTWWDRCARLSTNWDMRLWTDSANRAFMARHYPQHLPMYDGYDLNIKRVDSIRYFLLYHYGGVYMDADFACVRGLDSVTIRDKPGTATLILQRKSFADHEAVSNAWMAAPPRHPFFAFVIAQLNGSATRSHVLDATGPRFLTRAWRLWNQGEVWRREMVTKEAVTLSVPPWVLLFRVRSCRPSNIPGPPCTGRYNYPPCHHGKEEELDRCALQYPNASLTTFWTKTWIQDFYLSKGYLKNDSGIIHKNHKNKSKTVASGTKG